MTPGYVDSIVVEAVVNGAPGYYIVRGYSHPSNRVIVEPYKTSSCRGRPRAHQTFVDCLGVKAYTVEKSRVLRILSTRRSLALLPQHARRKVEELLDILGLEWAGLTGSYVVHCESSGSDVDIVALYKRGVWRTLMDLYSEGAITQCKTRHVLDKRIRGPGGVAFERYKIERSLTDTCYKGVPYTLRLITMLEDKPCTTRLTPIGMVEAVVYLKPLGEPVTVPSRYEGRVIAGLGVGGEVLVESWRTRYQELPPGYYRVKGLLRLDQGGNYILSPDHGGVIARA